MTQPLAIDLYAGLGGWSSGLIAEGWRCIGVDIEAHVYGEHRYPADLMIRDVLTIHGSLFRDAHLIVGSSPCQEFSYRAMPWKRAKALGPPLLGMELFHAQFRIQREASEAAGRHIPMVCENVRGAQKWVGRARWNFGSFYLWGDVPALMPQVKREFKVGGTDLSKVGFNMACVRKFSHGDPNVTMEEGRKLPGFRFDGSGRSFQSASVEGTKQGGDWFAEARKGGKGGTSASYGSKSSARKFASAMIARIPVALSRHIGATFYPRAQTETEAA